MNLFKKLFSHEALLEVIVGAAAAGLALLALVLVKKPLSQVEQELIVGGCSAAAMLIFGLFRHWENSAIKIRLFLAPLAGTALALLARYAFAPTDAHWTMYTFMNLVEPSEAVQNAFTLMGFGCGAVTMIIFGKSFFAKPRFFCAFLAGAAAVAGAGYSISVRILPALTQIDHPNWLESHALQLLLNYGLSAAIFVGAFMFFLVILPGHNGKNAHSSLRTK